jgi:hypothetical protein
MKIEIISHGVYRIKEFLPDNIFKDLYSLVSSSEYLIKRDRRDFEYGIIIYTGNVNKEFKVKVDFLLSKYYIILSKLISKLFSQEVSVNPM